MSDIDKALSTSIVIAVVFAFIVIGLQWERINGLKRMLDSQGAWNASCVEALCGTHTWEQEGMQCRGLEDKSKYFCTTCKKEGDGL